MPFRGTYNRSTGWLGDPPRLLLRGRRRSRIDSLRRSNSKIYLSAVALVALALVGFSCGQSGPPGEYSQGLTAPETGALDAAAEAPPPVDQCVFPRLESRLAELYLAAAAGDEESLAAFAGQEHVDLAAGTVRVILEMDVDPEAHQAGPATVETVVLADGQTVQIEHAPPVAIRPDLAAAIAAAGATYETAYEDWVQVLAPFTRLGALSEIEGVRYVRLPLPAQRQDLPL